MRHATRRLAASLLAGALAISGARAAPAAMSGARAAPADLAGRSMTELLADMDAGRLTAEAITAWYLDRIARLDRAGPALHAVLSLNPHALAEARAADAARRAGHAGRLAGVPVLIKDNIETRELPTTAGSLALEANETRQDAPIVARLRAAGAIVLGKANLSEWANYRGSRAVSGWSGLGGLTRNPHALDRTACGSSSGSGAGIAASLAAAALGSETDGSITCPASVNGIVGFKPTLGLLPRSRIVPLAHSQDTAGPMTHTVRDAAVLLGIMAGTDAADPASAEADAHRADFTAALRPDALRGARLGVLRFEAGFHPETDAVFAHALDVLRAAGAELVDIESFAEADALGAAEGTVLASEFKADIDAYLAGTPTAVRARSLAALIDFNKGRAARELGLFGQELFEKAQATAGLADPAYGAALATARRLARDEGIDRMLREHRVSALVAPTAGPASVVDTVVGDNIGGRATTLPAVAGYPHACVPMGAVFGLPVGLSVIGGRWDDARVLAYAYAFEQAAQVRLAPRFTAGLRTTPAVEDLLKPYRR